MDPWVTDEHLHSNKSKGIPRNLGGYTLENKHGTQKRRFGSDDFPLKLGVSFFSKEDVNQHVPSNQ